MIIKNIRIKTIAFIMTHLIIGLISYWISKNLSSFPDLIKPFFDGFAGNITSSFICCVVAMYFSRDSETKLNTIQNSTTKNNESIVLQEKRIENKRLIRQFKKFTKRGITYNIRLPDIIPHPNSLGLEYSISPIQGKEIKKSTFIVKVIEPAFKSFLTTEQLNEYEKSPILDGEYYFCEFFNNSWHMRTEALPIKNFRFYLSSSVIMPLSFLDCANEYMFKFFEDPYKDMKKISEFILIERQHKLIHWEASCKIYQAENKDIFLQIKNSLPKKLYYTNKNCSYDVSLSWILVIENMGGHAYGPRLRHIKEGVLEHLNAINISLPKIPWWELSNY